MGSYNTVKHEERLNLEIVERERFVAARVLAPRARKLKSRDS